MSTFEIERLKARNRGHQYFNFEGRKHITKLPEERFGEWRDKMNNVGNHQHCGKIPHDSEKRARKAMVQAKTKGASPRENSRKGPKFWKNKCSSTTNVYLCKICGKWHWGHKREPN